MEEPVVNSCSEVPARTSGKGLQRWTKAGAEEGAGADEGWSPSDSAASLHKSRQGRKPLQTEPTRRLLSQEAQEGVRGSQISFQDWICVCVFKNPREDELPKDEEIVCN